jgi:outer membrane protein assembly factor BamB
MSPRSRKLLACRFILLALLLVGCGGGDELPEITEVSQPSATPNAAGDWPRFLGPRIDGVSQATDWKSDWPEDGPKKLWTAKVGIGFGSIAVGGGRAITVGHSGGQDMVHAFDAETGKPLWRHSYKSALVDNLYEGGPNATPTIDADRVYTLGKEGQLFALEAANGEVAWEANLTKELGVKMPDWGFSSSPLVVGEYVIVDGGHTAAFDRKTGKLAWKSAEAHRPGYGSVTSFERDGETLLAVLNNEFLLILRASDGDEIARHPWETSFATSACTPLVVGDQIYISTGYNQGCALYKLVGDKLDVVYENKKMRNHFNNSVLWKGNLYGFDGQSNVSRQVHLVCMDFATGEVRWKERGLGCGSLIAADGKLIALGDAGDLVVAEANAEGYKPISKAKVLEGRCWTTPALAHGRIYCRNAAGDLVCLDVRK